MFFLTYPVNILSIKTVLPLNFLFWLFAWRALETPPGTSAHRLGRGRRSRHHHGASENTGTQTEIAWGCLSNAHHFTEKEEWQFQTLEAIGCPLSKLTVLPFKHAGVGLFTRNGIRGRFLLGKQLLLLHCPLVNWLKLISSLIPCWKLPLGVTQDMFSAQLLSGHSSRALLCCHCTCGRAALPPKAPCSQAGAACPHKCVCTPQAAQTGPLTIAPDRRADPRISSITCHWLHITQVLNITSLLQCFLRGCHPHQPISQFTFPSPL